MPRLPTSQRDPRIPHQDNDRATAEVLDDSDWSAGCEPQRNHSSKQAPTGEQLHNDTSFTGRQIAQWCWQERALLP